MARGNCIVTGGAGFIGRAVSAGLVDRFDHVVAFDCLHPQVHPKRLRPSALHPLVELVDGDCTDAAAWDALLGRLRPDLVVHLAAETGVGQSLTDATSHGRTNVTGTTVMLDAFTRHQALPGRMVLASSRAVYGEGAWAGADGAVHHPGQRSRDQLARREWDFPGLHPMPSRADETRPTPVSIYGATKLAQEHVMSAWAMAMGVGLCVLRLQNVYGPGQSLANSYTGIVSLFCRQARLGERISLYEDGAMLRDFVLIDDVAAALLHAADLLDAAKQQLDVGTGRATPLAEVGRQVAAIYGAPEPEICGAYRYGDVRHAFCSIDKTTVLGWVPRNSLEEGLARLTAWIETQLEPVSRRSCA